MKKQQKTVKLKEVLENLRQATMLIFALVLLASALLFTWRMKYGY